MVYKFVVFTLAAGAGLVASIVAVGVLLHDGSPPASSGDASVMRAVPAPCSEQQSSGIALLARIAPGHTSAELISAGYQVRRAISQGEDDLVVVYGGSRDAVLTNNSAISRGGLLLAQTSDPELRACSYKFSDNGKALDIARNAIGVFVTSGLVEDREVQADSTLYMLTDDPTNPEHLFFAAVLSSPGSSSLEQSLTPVVATVDRSSGAILNAGFGAWYAGQ